MPKISSLSHFFNAQADSSDLKLMALELVASKSEAKSESEFEINKDADHFSNFFRTKTNWTSEKTKKNQYTS